MLGTWNTNRHTVRYLIVEAHAVAANGRPRATQDIDFSVEPTRANAERRTPRQGTGRFRLLGRAQLLANKRASGRTKDKLDVELVTEDDE